MSLQPAQNKVDDPSGPSSASQQSPPPSSRAKGVSIRALLGASGNLAADSKQRASILVASMESYLGRNLSPSIKLFAMAAVSGIAISTAVAARAGTIGASKDKVRNPGCTAARMESLRTKSLREALLTPLDRSRP